MIKFLIKLSDFIKFHEVYWHTLEEQGANNIHQDILDPKSINDEFHLSKNIFLNEQIEKV